MANLNNTTIFSVMSALSTQYNAINLGQGFPDFDCTTSLKDEVKKSLYSNQNQYSPMTGNFELKQSIADKIAIYHHNVVDPNKHICITAGATQAIFTSILSIISKDDEVIIIEPAYDSYAPSIRIAGGIPISYKMKYPKYQIDWDELESLVSEKTKMIIINNPHNPTGKILTKSDLLNLQRIVSDTKITVLSDEVYEHLIFDNNQHESVLRFPELFNQSIAIFSFGKTLHATGWKIGYCVGPEHLINQFNKIHQWNVFSVNSFVQHALAQYLKEPEKFNKLSSFFEQKRNYLADGLNESHLKPLPSLGTYFQLYDFSEISQQNDIEFCKSLVKKIGVASIPLSPFYSDSEDNKVIRLCFAKKQETLDKAIERLKMLN